MTKLEISSLVNKEWKRINLFFALIMAFLFILQIQGQKAPRVKTVMLNRFYDGVLKGERDNDQWAFFRLNLNDQQAEVENSNDTSTEVLKNTTTKKLSELGENWDLIIQVEQLNDQFSDPNLFISYGSELPTMLNFSVRCAFYGEDFCVINSRELKNKSEITIGVSCLEECDFRLQTEVSEELLLETGRQYKLYFHAEQERVVRFSIPNDTNITTVELKGINANKFDRFNMIMAKGNAVPTSENALYLRPAWENGYVGKFTEDCQCFCRGCNYTVLVSSEKAGYISLSGKVSGQVIDLKTYETQSEGGVAEVYDSVMYYHSQCYSYKVTDESKDLKIKLESFAGDPNIYVNPLQLPKNLGDSVFNSRDHFENEELILTPVERANANATKGDYFICVFGNTAATYKLTVSNQDHSIFLLSGLSQSGYVDNNEVGLFYYRDPILASEGTNITFQLHAMSGKARLRAKLCTVNFTDEYQDFKANCTIPLEDMLADDPNEKQEAHLGSQSDATNISICKMPDDKSPRGAKVSCVFVVGVVGLNKYQTHYSVLLKVAAKAHHTVLKEGVPLQAEIMETTPSYFLASVHNPNATKVSFQLTTIHGDPDVFISRTEKEPTPQLFDKRSIRCGIYPEQVQFDKEPNKTLEGDYYIMVYGFVQSTFSIVYFVEDANATISKVQLLVGQKQKGVLKSVNDSMVYHFRLSNEIREDVQVRLQSENGHFIMWLSYDDVPGQKNFTYQGDDRNPIIFRQKDKSKQEDVTSIDYYIKVMPIASLNDTAGMAYQYTIAFYEEGSFIHLVEGIPNAGSVANDTFDYYQLDINRDSVYEIVLTPKAGGNPDLVVSLDPANPFPTKESHQFISEDTFSTDSLAITQQMISDYEKQQLKMGVNMTVRSLQIGVYTSDQSECSYTILVTKQNDFTPILLTNGQPQDGQLEASQAKYYYFKTGSQSPLYASLVPRAGDPNLAIYVIQNLSASMYQWPEYLKARTRPDFESKEVFEADIIYLDSKDPRFKNVCGSSCILILKIDNNSKKDKAKYSLQVNRDTMELQDSVRIEDSITEEVQYKYYKFFKPPTTDLEVTITPHQENQKLTLLISNGQLPTMITENLLAKKAVLTSTDVYVQAEANESQTKLYLIAVHSKMNASFMLEVHTFPHVSADQLSKGDHLGLKRLYLGESPDIKFQPGEIKYFYFENWVNSTLKIQYYRARTSFQSLQDAHDDVEGTNEEDTRKRQQARIEIEVSPWESRKLPKDSFQFIGAKWLTNIKEHSSTQMHHKKRFQNTLILDPHKNKDLFCVQCNMIVRIQNMNKEHPVDVRMMVSQNDEEGNGFVSHLIMGKPTPVKLSAKEKALLNFKVTSTTPLTLTIQYFTGEASVSMWTPEQDSYQSLTSPSSKTKSRFDLETIATASSLQLTISKGLQVGETYQLMVEPSSPASPLHAVLLLLAKDQVEIVSDGIPTRLFFNSELPSDSRYFSYLPPSPKFQLALSVKPFTLGGAPYTVYIKRYSTTDVANDEGLRRSLLGEKSGADFDKLMNQVRKGLPGQLKESQRQQQWWERIFQNATETGSTTAVTFDYIFKRGQEQEGNHSQMDLFQVIPIEMADNQDAILVKVEVVKPRNALSVLSMAELELTLSGSEIQFLQPGQRVRGHVSNFNSTYKIFELHVNKEKLNDANASDIYIEVTPCNGRVNFFVSDDYLQLFNKDKQVHTSQTQDKNQPFFEIVTQQKYGKMATRVPNLKVLAETSTDKSQALILYIGIMSSNELYSTLSSQLDSYFEVYTQLIGPTKEITQNFVMRGDSSQQQQNLAEGIQLSFDRKRGRDSKDDVVIRWGELYEKVASKNLADSYTPVQPERISYRIYASNDEQAALNMNSLCAVEYSANVFELYIRPSDEKDREVRISRADIENVKVIGLIAQVRDPVTRQVVNLAYEPYLIRPQDLYGVKLQTYQIVVLILMGMTSLFCLGCVVYCLRRKSIKLQKRLETAPQAYTPQQDDTF